MLTRFTLDLLALWFAWPLFLGCGTMVELARIHTFEYDWVMLRDKVYQIRSSQRPEQA